MERMSKAASEQRVQSRRPRLRVCEHQRSQQRGDNSRVLSLGTDPCHCYLWRLYGLWDRLPL